MTNQSLPKLEDVTDCQQVPLLTPTVGRVSGSVSAKPDLEVSSNKGLFINSPKWMK